MATTDRPDLTPVPLEAVIPYRAGRNYIVIPPGRWNEQLAEAYRQAWTLLAVDGAGHIIAAYCKSGTTPGPAPTSN